MKTVRRKMNKKLAANGSGRGGIFLIDIESGI